MLIYGGQSRPENERRNPERNSGYYEIPYALALGANIVNKTQSIVSRATGARASQELLIDAPEREIVKMLSDSELGFQIFLSQLIRAFQTGEHSHINIDLSSLKRPDFIARTQKVLSNFRRRGERSQIVIEVTERGAKSDVFQNETARSMQFLKRSGFSLFADDFDPFGRIEGSVSSLVLAKYNSLLTGVKFPYQYKDEFLTPSRERSQLLASISPTKKIILEGMGLAILRGHLPVRIAAIQDPTI